MNYIKLSDTRVSRDCVLIWGLLRDNPGITLSDLYEVLGDDKWKESRKWKVAFCSNLAYVLKRLREIRAIEIIQNRNTGGEFDYATINLIAEPVIRKEVNLCRECGVEFKKKGFYSKHKDICLECTKKLYMTPKISKCFRCGDSGAAKGMKIINGDSFHQNCYKEYKDEKIKIKRAELAEQQRKGRYCIECGITEIKKQAKFCKPCLRIRLSNRYSKVICDICGLLPTEHGMNTCYSAQCMATNYIKTDAYFNNRRRDPKAKESIVKKKILGESCIICGYSSFINYHHVIFRENGGQDVMSNIVPVCPNHHMEIHHCGLDVSKEHALVLQRLKNIAEGRIIISLE